MQKQDLVIFQNRAVAGNTSYESSPIYVGDVEDGSIQVKYVADAATVSGTFKLQASSDPAGETPTVWTDVTGSSTTVTTQASGTAFYNLSDIGYNWIKVVFTYSGTSNSQVVNGRAVLKGE